MSGDCILGIEPSNSSLLNKKSNSERSSETETFIDRGSPTSSCDSVWGYSVECSQHKNLDDGSPIFTNLESVNIYQSDWLEKWMDLNGVFDPNIELPCTDIDVSFYQLRQDSSGTGLCECEQCQNKDCAKCDSLASKDDRNFEDLNQCNSSVLQDINEDCSFDECNTLNLESPREEHSKPKKSTEKGLAFTAVIERKREQNRSAAVRYREKRREEAKRKKEELHELELRNVALKTEVSGLTAEIAYLKGLLHDVLRK